MLKSLSGPCAFRLLEDGSSQELKTMAMTHVDHLIAGGKSGGVEENPDKTRVFSFRPGISLDGHLTMSVHSPRRLEAWLLGHFMATHPLMN